MPRKCVSDGDFNRVIGIARTLLNEHPELCALLKRANRSVLTPLVREELCRLARSNRTKLQQRLISLAKECQGVAAVYVDHCGEREGWSDEELAAFHSLGQASQKAA